MLLLLLLSSLLLAPIPAGGETLCAECRLGVFDDRAMTRVFGTIQPFQIKSVYVGLRAGSEIASLRDLQFDASYPKGFTFLDVTSFVDGAVIEPLAADRVRVRWTACVPGSGVLFRVRFLSFRSVHDATVQIRDAQMTPCTGGPPVGILGGCYVLNPTGKPTPCTTSLGAATWTTMKELFK
jgi:hypothetical protein